MGAIQCPHHGNLGDKKFCWVKESLSDWMKTQNYSIEVVYNGLIGIKDKVCWANAMWN